LIEQRRKGVIDYQDYLTTIAELTRQATNPGGGSASYPAALDTSARRALYDNLGRDEGQALAVDRAVRDSRQDGWRSNPLKVKMVRLAIKAALVAANPDGLPRQTKESSGPYEAGAVEDIEVLTNRMVELVKNQHEY
ncbi:MAG TPA: restriction endonuclease subunit R, partial [Chloroflexota bacterium]|nr:restriction endonuclease subunit R [Chloroflexota bacterium]